MRYDPDAPVTLSAKEHNELKLWRMMFSDLDRNEQGRHEGDEDYGTPGGVSLGNPLFKTGDTIGYSLGGSFRYVMPPQGQRHDPRAWHVRNDPS